MNTPPRPLTPRHDLWYNPAMKSFAFLLPLIAPLAVVSEVVVGPIPSPDCQDTEVSTNFAFSVGEGQGRSLVFTVELQASPSNNVEVAIGVDADEDGDLSIDEAELCVGYDCGTWFARSALDDSATTAGVADSGVFRRTYRVRGRYVNPSWNLVKVKRRGDDVAAESVSVANVDYGFMVRLL